MVVGVPGVDGLAGFVPTSKLDPARLPPTAASPPKSLVGTTIRAKVVQVDAARRKLILSERAACLGELAAAVASLSGPAILIIGETAALADVGAAGLGTIPVLATEAAR